MEELDKKKKIVLAAISEFAKEGFEKASIDAIALKAKVAKGTVFYHFRSKSVLFAEIVEEGQRLLEEKMKKETKLIPTSRQKLEKIIEIEVNFVKKYRDLFLVYLGDVVKKKVRFKEIDRIIAQGIKNKELRDDVDPKMASLALFWLTAMICLDQGASDARKIQKIVLQGILK